MFRELNKNPEWGDCTPVRERLPRVRQTQTRKLLLMSNDTSSVVAAGYIFGNDAGAYATIVKLARTTMIIPISLLFSMLMAIHKKREAAITGEPFNIQLKTIFPWFILWFLIASFLHTIGVIPEGVQPYISHIGKFMIVMALTAIGLNADFRKMVKTGFKPILLGLIVWTVFAIVSLLVQFTIGNV